MTDVPAAIRIVGLEKHFRRTQGSEVAALNGVSLEVGRGEMVAVLGPSGCGKTTLLRCVAGLERPSRGEIWSGDELVSDGHRGIVVPPERRNFGMMFQSYAVWPHLSVFNNVAYPLRIRRVPRQEIDRRVREILDLVGIGHLRDEFSAQLSGGQQQRIALARCLVADPEVILFDEPLSNVDAKVREELRIELLTMQKRIGFAGLYVTHDQEEAMAIAQRIVVMHAGNAVQVGTPREIYRSPVSRFVAGFIGIANEWEGGVLGRGDGSGPVTVSTPLGDVYVDPANVESGLESGAAVVVVCRPEALTVGREAPNALIDGSSQNVWRGVLEAEMFRGSHSEYLLNVGGVVVRARAPVAIAFREGDEVVISAAPSDLRVLAKDDTA